MVQLGSIGCASVWEGGVSLWNFWFVACLGANLCTICACKPSDLRYDGVLLRESLPEEVSKRIIETELKMFRLKPNIWYAQLGMSSAFMLVAGLCAQKTIRRNSYCLLQVPNYFSREMVAVFALYKVAENTCESDADWQSMIKDEGHGLLV